MVVAPAGCHDDAMLVYSGGFPRTGASVTIYADGDIFDAGCGTSAFNDAAEELVEAVQHDQGLTISDSNDKK